jgi:hypothetical protein
LSGKVLNIRGGIACLALVLLVILAVVKWQGADQKLLLILILASALLVGLLLITYRAFEGVAETARNLPQPVLSPDDDEEI